MALLEVIDIHTFYDNIEALKGISLEVEEGEIVTLIGSNGAGKSTTMWSISGLTPTRDSSITSERRGQVHHAALNRAARPSTRRLDQVRGPRDRRDRSAGHRPPRHIAVTRG